MCQCRKLKRCGFDPWVGKNPWRRKWEPTPVFLPGWFHWQRCLAGYNPWDLTESDMTEWLSILIMSSCLGLSVSCSRWVRKELMMIEGTVSRKGNSYWTLSAQSLSNFQLSVTSWTTAHQASLSITNSRSPPKPMSIKSIMLSNHLILCCPLLLLPSISSASGSFQMSQLFVSGDQSIGGSASTSVLPMNTQDWSPLGWTGFISLQSKGLSRVFSNTTVQKHQFFGTQLSL